MLSSLSEKLLKETLIAYLSEISFYKNESFGKVVVSGESCGRVPAGLWLGPAGHDFGVALRSQ